MRALRINGRRVPCHICKRRYAVIRWENTMSVCGCCNRAFFMGFMLGRNVGVDETYGRMKNKESE